MTTITSTDLPTRAECWHDEATILVGNALTIAVNTSQPYNDYAYQNAAVNGDSFTQSVFLRAGTYIMSILGVTGNNRGKVDWYLDGTLIVSGQDWYTAGTVYNVVVTVANVVVPFDGYHVLKGSINGANVASGGYALYLTKLWWKQTAD